MTLCHSFFCILSFTRYFWRYRHRCGLFQRNREGAGPDSNPCHLTTAQRQPLSYAANFGYHVAQIKRITLVVFLFCFLFPCIWLSLAGHMFIITSIDLYRPRFSTGERIQWESTNQWWALKQIKYRIIFRVMIFFGKTSGPVDFF